jgi:hypothetical protein
VTVKHAQEILGSSVKLVCGGQVVLAPSRRVFEETNCCTTGMPTSEDLAEMYVSLMERAVCDVVDVRGSVKLWLRRADDALVLLPDPLLRRIYCSLNRSNPIAANMPPPHASHVRVKPVGFFHTVAVHVCDILIPCGEPIATLPYTIEEVGASVPMLDMTVTLNDDLSLSTGVYRKPSDGPVRAHHLTDAPLAYRVAAVQSYAHRAATLCSSDALRTLEIATTIERSKTDLSSPQRVKATISRTLERVQRSDHIKSCMDTMRVCVVVSLQDNSLGIMGGTIVAHSKDSLTIKHAGMYLCDIPWNLVRALPRRAYSVYPVPWGERGHPNIWVSRMPARPPSIRTVRIPFPWLGETTQRLLVGLLQTPDPANDNIMSKVCEVAWRTKKLKEYFQPPTIPVPPLLSACVYVWICKCGMLYVGMTARPLYLRSDEHRTSLCAKTPCASNAMVRHLLSLPAAIRTTLHGWSGPIVVFKDTCETKLRVAEALLVLSLPPTATANALVDRDEETHPSRRTMNLHRGWVTAAARWVHNWPTNLLTKEKVAGARLIQRVKEDGEAITRLPSFASTALAADISILLSAEPPPAPPLPPPVAAIQGAAIPLIPPPRAEAPVAAPIVPSPEEVAEQDMEDLLMHDDMNLEDDWIRHEYDNDDGTH